MKKILTVALCSMAVCSLNAQKTNVDAAKKLSGKIDKVEEARGLINEAKTNDETKNDPNTYFIAGKIEFDAYDSAKKKQMFNPQDKDVNPVNMSTQVVNGYNELIQVIPLDKQDPKQKLTKDALKMINSHFEDYNIAGGTFYQNEMVYPQAYEAFMIFANLPKSEYADKKVAATPDSISNLAYYNAGLCAYNNKAYEDAAKAFKAARLNNYDKQDAFIREIASWQAIANDSTKTAQAKVEIDEIAKAGLEKFGATAPFFINNVINDLLTDEKYDEAIKVMTDNISSYPDNSNLYGLLAYVYGRSGKDDESLEAYRKASTLNDVSYETLSNYAQKLYRVGTGKYNAVDMKDQAGRQAIKAEYFEEALNVAKKAKELNPKSTDVDRIIENIEYALETYFK